MNQDRKLITDEAIDSFDRAYMACAEFHANGDDDTSERCCIAAGLRTAGALLLRDAADLVDRGPTFPLPPSVISALLRERADDLAEENS